MFFLILFDIYFLIVLPYGLFLFLLLKMIKIRKLYIDDLLLLMNLSLSLSLSSLHSANIDFRCKTYSQVPSALISIVSYQTLKINRDDVDLANYPANLL